MVKRRVYAVISGIIVLAIVALVIININRDKNNLKNYEDWPISDTNVIIYPSGELEYSGIVKSKSGKIYNLTSRSLDAVPTREKIKNTDGIKFSDDALKFKDVKKIMEICVKNFGEKFDGNLWSISIHGNKRRGEVLIDDVYTINKSDEIEKTSISKYYGYVIHILCQAKDKVYIIILDDSITIS